MEDKPTGNDRSSIGTILGATAVGVTPTAVALDPTTEHVFVVCSGETATGEKLPSSVVMLDASTGQVHRTVEVGYDLHAIAIDSLARRVFIADSGPWNEDGDPVEAGHILLLDPATGDLLGTSEVGIGPHSITVDSGIGRVVVTNGISNSVCVLETLTGRVLWQVPVGYNPVQAAILPGNGQAVVLNRSNRSTIVFLDLQAGSVLQIIQVGKVLSDITVDVVHGLIMAVDHDASRIYVISTDGELQGGLDVAAGPIRLVHDRISDRVFLLHRTLTKSGEDSGGVTVLGPSARMGLRPILWTVPVEGFPNSLTVDERHGYVYATSVRERAVSILDVDADTASSMVVKVVATPMAPRDVVVAPHAEFVFVICDEVRRDRVTMGTAIRLDAGPIRDAKVFPDM